MKTAAGWYFGFAHSDEDDRDRPAILEGIEHV
jgi:hypothetical protein